ncbi:hypothetical protein ACFOGI_09875 [Virgibacillus xinjiangensis]|uniref:Uncharacterized protein n=1 Tax=Virgibacillus xinjiangensis TaxID=393090 RepID=A0ABV7CW59_9BACI
MNLDWFDRVTGELQDSLNSICEKYDETGSMLIERGAKHPRIDFFTENGEEIRDYFCTLFFDPYNEEFYIHSIDPEYGQVSKVILEDIEDIIDAVHESFHDFMDDDIAEVELVDENVDTVYTEEDEVFYEELDVAWETPEVTAYYQENEVEVTYQFGIAQDTGEGVIRRLHRMFTEDDMIKDETVMSFGKEEASTLIAMVASHMDAIEATDYLE